MKKMVGFIMAVMLICSTVAFAGGDQNKHRHDGSKGKGQTNQERINK
jgi:hypothetical protein